MLKPMLICRLPASYDSLTIYMDLDMDADKTLTYDELKDLVRTYWRREILGKGSGGQGGTTKALMAKGDDSSSGVIIYIVPV